MTISDSQAKRRPADVLRQARLDESTRKRKAVFVAVDSMRRDGTLITFAAVARTAKVSQWLVYADGVREHIAAARDAQAVEPAQAKRLGHKASEASLRTDLELSRQDNKALRAELAKLKILLRERLGERLEAESSESLRRRVDELSEANIRHRSELAQLKGELEAVRGQLATTEDDLAAARMSLRRMIKSQTADLEETRDGVDDPELRS
jgi:chromosome segregation ATPase